METESRTLLMDSYADVPRALGHETLWYREFGSYSGEWLAMSFHEGSYFLWKDWYGSCSYCDAIQHASFDADQSVIDFANDYSPFMEMTAEAALRIAARDGNLLTALPANVRSEAGVDGIPLEEVGRQLALTVLDREGGIEAREILEIDNLEGRRTAIDRYGPQAWTQDLGAVKIHDDGPNSLWRLDRDGEEPFVFLLLKDGSTDRRYVLRVEPTHVRVRQARAWTFNIPEDEFDLTVET